MDLKRIIALLFVNLLFVFVIIITCNSTFVIGVNIAMMLAMDISILLPEISKMAYKTKKMIIDYNYFKNNIEFYRDIIKEYSMGELAIIDGYEFECPKDIVAMLLKLELNKNIKIEDDKIIILSHDSLKKSEKYLLNNIIQGRLKIKNINKFKRKIENEARYDGLLIKNNEFEAKDLILLVLSFILYGVLFTVTENTTVILSGFFFILMLFIIMIGKAIANTILIELSDKGKELNLKLHGLSNLLKDFSVMDIRDKEELVLWEDYLIYSVMFGINKKIVDDYIKFIIIE